ncbi:hypothetical protein LGH70_11045 [Hymenobacter sp. BT635]|uniref:Uncharacterized protein n=1 Tax=Hymenobacter nitidus TaxID=2880929 RepID=A0ABS8ACL4_9BACT|nr:hypothetical protein [Hymenobacter nitidus]MCB2378122.1 hypothetical protein [Hymenobacter nitidus]
MHTSILRPVLALALVLLLVSSVAALAGNPYARAQQRGRRYVHRPVYKYYQPQAHKAHRSFALFRK